MANSLKDILKKAEKEILILGINPLKNLYNELKDVIINLVILNSNLTITIYYESDSENFNQSLLTDTRNSINRNSYISFSAFKDRIKSTYGLDSKDKKTIISGLYREIAKEIEGKSEFNLNNLIILQNNLRLPVNIIKVDDELYFSITTNTLPTINDYIKANNDNLKNQLLNHIDFISNPNKAAQYLSDSNQQLIQLYDKKNIPRGIYPRSAFYTTEFKKYAIWGFIFNRKGEFLLHRRSLNVKDNRALWDKSFGGHVDPDERLSAQTAKREFIEELFLPEDDDTPYIGPKTTDIINFGDWNPNKRTETNFKSTFQNLSNTDWILFLPTDEKGRQLRIDRVSKRVSHKPDNTVSNRRAIFISDVFFLISPEGKMDTDEQMKNLVKMSLIKGAASDHKLISVESLREWIEDEEKEGRLEQLFTDDLLYINTEIRNITWFSLKNKLENKNTKRVLLCEEI